MAINIETELFESSWGDIRLFASDVNWDAGNTVIVHDLAQGNVHPPQRRGNRARRARLTILFDEFAGVTESPIARFRRFQTAVDNEERRIFQHPMLGSYFAIVGDFEPKGDENSVFSATCEFIPDGEVQPVSPAGAGTTATSGEGSVFNAADLMDTSLDDVGLGFPPENASKIDFAKPVALAIPAAFTASAGVDVAFSANVSASFSANASIQASASASAEASASASVLAFASAYARAAAVTQSTAVVDVAGSVSGPAFAFSYAAAALSLDARVSAASWGNEDVSMRKVLIDAARLSDSIAAMIEIGGFEGDLQLWPALRAAILLGDAVHSAAAAATSDTPSVFVMRVLDPTALLPLAGRIYGGRDAQERARQITSLNDIRRPGWLDPGDYVMPARPPSSKSAFGGGT